MGGPIDFWVKDFKLIEKFIRKYKLSPQTKLIPNLPSKVKPAHPFIPDSSIHGGMRTPHIHFKNDIYILNEKQWKNFSESVLKNFRSTLEKVNTVNFEQLMELSDAINNLN
jgi:hypothetical protein